MQKSKVFWFILMVSAVVLYLFGLGLCFFSSTPLIGVGLFFGILFLHLAELKTALQIGRIKQLSDSHIWLMDLVFGFTWWLPLKMGIFKS
ncbi:MAG TPA: hypothetical protein VLR89_06965 [Anaerolineaceae bacterium]|nr:hypothetical protein [Anaerolineaceae bacterium]